MDIFKSSQDPKQVSMTVQGMLMAFVPIFIAVFQILEIPVAESQIMDVIKQVSVVIAGITMIAGMVRKVANLAKISWNS